MSIRHEPTLWCDGIEDDEAPTGVRHAEPGPDFLKEPGCPFWIQDGIDAPAIRRNARRVGWKRIAGRDYSPQCARLLQSSLGSVPTGQDASE